MMRISERNGSAIVFLTYGAEEQLPNPVVWLTMVTPPPLGLRPVRYAVGSPPPTKPSMLKLYDAIPLDLRAMPIPVLTPLPADVLPVMSMQIVGATPATLGATPPDETMMPERLHPLQFGAPTLLFLMLTSTIEFEFDVARTLMPEPSLPDVTLPLMSAVRCGASLF